VIARISGEERRVLRAVCSWKSEFSPSCCLFDGDSLIENSLDVASNKRWSDENEFYVSKKEKKIIAYKTHRLTKKSLN